MNADKIESMSALVIARCDSPWGRVTLKMNKAEQVAMFGQYMGRGTIIVDGEAEEVRHVVSCCFGQDYEVTKTVKWIDL